MNRKVRHPHQIVDASELVVNDRYAIVRAHNRNDVDVTHYVMCGEFGNSAGTARKRGYDLHSEPNPQLGMLAQSPANEPAITIHTDGWWWHGARLSRTPILMYWRDDGNKEGWDYLSIFLGPFIIHYFDGHRIVVPSQKWDDDPHLHSADWDNPDGVIERAFGGVGASVSESAIDFDRRMKAKYDAAMARALGF